MSCNHANGLDGIATCGVVKQEKHKVAESGKDSGYWSQLT